MPTLRASRCSPALPCRFEQHDTSGDRDIQAVNMTEHRNRGEDVAALTDETTESSALGAKHQCRRQREIHAVVRLRGCRVETHRPDAKGLQFFEGARDVDDIDDGHPGHGAGGRLRGGRGERRGTALLTNQPPRTHRIDRPQDRTHVVRILDSIEYDDERRLLAGRCEIRERCGVAIVELSDDTLVDPAARLAVEDGDVHALYLDIRLCRQIQQLTDACVSTRSNAHAAYPPGSQGLSNGVDTVHQQ